MRLLCLASSDMPGGRCIAGKELLANGDTGRWHIGKWIRLVSDRAGEGVKCRYTDGTEPHVLDVMDVPVLEPHPEGYQQENWLLDPGRWRKVRRMAPNDLTQFTDPTSSLWIDGDSSLKGQNDQIPPCKFADIDNSLRLIKIDGMDVRVFTYYSKRRVQGCFRYNKTNYWLKITDPDYKEQYWQKGDGCYSIGECFLTISLTAKPFDDGYAYKLIAAVMKP